MKPSSAVSFQTATKVIPPLPAWYTSSCAGYPLAPDGVAGEVPSVPLKVKGFGAERSDGVLSVNASGLGGVALAALAGADMTLATDAADLVAACLAVLAGVFVVDAFDARHLHEVKGVLVLERAARHNALPAMLRHRVDRTSCAESSISH